MTEYSGSFCAVLQREKVAAELRVAQREISHGAIVLQLKICFTYIYNN